MYSNQYTRYYLINRERIYEQQTKNKLVKYYKCFIHNYDTYTKSLYILHILNNDCFTCYLKR